MKTIHRLLLIILISNFTVFAQSSAKEETAKISKKESNASAIMAKSMKAYQLKSESKIQEFYSYLNILGKTEVKPEMKQHTILEIKKLFKDETIEIPNFLKDPSKKIPLTDFLNLVSKTNESYYFTIENVSHSYVQADNKNQQLFWTIAYTLNLHEGKSLATFTNVMQNVSLLQQEKKFGTNTKLVWNSYLTSLWLK